MAALCWHPERVGDINGAGGPTRSSDAASSARRRSASTVNRAGRRARRAGCASTSPNRHRCTRPAGRGGTSVC